MHHHDFLAWFCYIATKRMAIVELLYSYFFKIYMWLFFPQCPLIFPLGNCCYLWSCCLLKQYTTFFRAICTAFSPCRFNFDFCYGPTYCIKNRHCMEAQGLALQVQRGLRRFFWPRLWRSIWAGFVLAKSKRKILKRREEERKAGTTVFRCKDLENIHQHAW